MRRPTIVVLGLFALLSGCGKSDQPGTATKTPPTIQDLVALSKMNEWDADGAIKNYVGSEMEAEFNVDINGGTKEQDIYRVSGKSPKTQTPRIYFSCEYPWSAGRDFQAVKEGDAVKVRGKISKIVRTQSGAVEVSLDQPRKL